MHYLKLGVVDYANVSASRELVSALTENRIFVVSSYPATEQGLSRQVETGKLTVGIVIPPEFRRNLSQGKTAEIQAFIDGVDANTAGIASGYMTQILRQFNFRLAGTQPNPLVKPEVIFLYSPGAIAPIETMPTFFQVVSLLNPLRHYIAIVRGVLLKGVGLEALWIHTLTLAASAIVLLIY